MQLVCQYDVVGWQDECAGAAGLPAPLRQFGHLLIPPRWQSRPQLGNRQPRELVAGDGSWTKSGEEEAWGSGQSTWNSVVCSA